MNTEAHDLSALIRLLPLLPSSPKRRGVIYRHLDSDGRLLYLGSSDEQTFKLRQIDHSRNARWWRFVDQIEHEYVTDRREAYAASRRAAPVESPIFNRLPQRTVGVQDVIEACYSVAHADVDLWPDMTRSRRAALTRSQKTTYDRAMLDQLLRR